VGGVAVTAAAVLAGTVALVVPGLPSRPAPAPSELVAGSAPPSDAELTACSPGVRPGDRVPQGEPFVPDPLQTWVVATGVTATGSVPAPGSGTWSAVLLRQPSTVAGTGRVSGGRMPARDAALLQRLDGDRVLLRTRLDARPPATLHPVAVLHRAGTVVPMVGCGGFPDELAALAERAGATGRTPAEVLLAAVRDPASRDADALLDLGRSYLDIPWERRDPVGRTYDEAPPEVRRLLHEVMVEVIVPAAWRAFPDAVFTRTEVASRGGAAFGAFSTSAAAHARLGSTAQDGLPLLVVLSMDGSAPQRVMVTIPEPVWRRALGDPVGVVVRVRPDLEALTSRDELLRRLDAGEEVLEVVRP
jgi:hypothetical protein